MNKRYWVMALVAVLVACSDQDTGTEVTSQIEPIDIGAEDNQTVKLLEFTDAANSFEQLAHQQATAMLNHCTSMSGAVQRFLAESNDTNLTEAQEQYRSCYRSWVGNRLFFQQPFSLSDSKNFQQLIDLTDTRPFQPGYIGGLPEYPYSGLVHELDIPLTEANLKSQHRLMDEESASVGFPVVEFFLWKSPADDFWDASAEGADPKVVSRRKDYLNEANELLLQNVTEVGRLWQIDGAFSRLPERAQLAFILKSMQRLVMVELLNKGFEETVLAEPDWYHPAVISGQGRDYYEAMLTTLLTFLNPDTRPEFSQWVARQENLNLPMDDLLTSLQNAQEALQQLPENYPYETTRDSEAWQTARRSLAQATVHLSQLSGFFQVTILTD